MQKILNRVTTLTRISWLKTVVIALRKKTTCLRVYPKVHIYLSSSSYIAGTGQLSLGSKWNHMRYFPSEFVLGDDAALYVNGCFSIYTGFHVSVANGAKLTLGQGYINNNVTIDCFKSITIGHRVVISKGVTIRDSDNHSIARNTEISSPIIIEDDVWVGLNATILKGVTIESGSVVAAGAVVTKNVPKNVLVGGVPARVIKENISWR